jgi:hypothetical protein
VWRRAGDPSRRERLVANTWVLALVGSGDSRCRTLSWRPPLPVGSVASEPGSSGPAVRASMESQWSWLVGRHQPASEATRVSRLLQIIGQCRRGGGPRPRSEDERHACRDARRRSIAPRRVLQQRQPRVPHAVDQSGPREDSRRNRGTLGDTQRERLGIARRSDPAAAKLVHPPRLRAIEAAGSRPTMSRYLATLTPVCIKFHPRRDRGGLSWSLDCPPLAETRLCRPGVGRSRPQPRLQRVQVTL